MSRRYAVILAGGRGERFWPLSTARRPKQLLDLVGDRSLLAQAVTRLAGLVPPERVLVITNDDLVDACREAAPELLPEQVIGEPVGRDTAPAAALACALVRRLDPEASFAILTADHVIGDLPLYRKTLEAGFAEAEQHAALVTIGLVPGYPSTGFGYIRAGEDRKELDGIVLRPADAFVEKPDRSTAEAYLAEGCYFWNSGMFIWTVSALEAALRSHRPQLNPLLDAVAAAADESGVRRALERIYPELEKISIDYAVMEHADNIRMVEGHFPWDDVGSWNALEHHFEADGAGNVAIGAVETLDAQNNIVYSRDHLPAVIGVRDLVVVQAEGVTLVCPKDRAQDVKQLLTRLRDSAHFEDLL